VEHKRRYIEEYFTGLSVQWKSVRSKKSLRSL